MNEEYDFVKSIRDMIGMIDTYNPTAYKLVQFQIDSCLQYECITKEDAYDLKGYLEDKYDRFMTDMLNEWKGELK